MRTWVARAVMLALGLGAGSGCGLILGIKDVTLKTQTGTGGAGTGGAGTGGAGTGGAPSDVQGHDIPIFLAPGTAVQTSVPVDLSTGHVLVALVPNKGGGFDTLDGEGHSDGSFTIKSVPAGPYYLHLDNDYYWLTGRTPELGGYTGGRSDQTAAVSGLTSATVNASALEPWVAEDEIEVVSFSANTLGRDIPGASGTMLSSVVDWKATMNPPNVLEASDVFKIVQLVNQTSPGGVDYRVATGQVSLTNVTMVDGMDTPLPDEALLPIGNADMQQLTLKNWNIPDYDAHVTDVHPNATVDPDGVRGGHAFRVTSLTVPTSYGKFGPMPDLVTINQKAGSPAVTDLMMSYGNAFVNLVEFCAASTGVRLSYKLPNANGAAATVTYSMFYHDELSVFEDETVGVMLTPAGDVKVDGSLWSNADNPIQTLASATPTLTWTAPTTGKPTKYVLTVQELTKGALGATNAKTSAVLRTAETSLVLPPGVLASGGTYVMALESVSSASDYQAFPNRGGLPEASAPVLSGMLAVP